MVLSLPFDKVNREPFSPGEAESGVRVLHLLRVLLHVVDGAEGLGLLAVVQTPVLRAVDHLCAFPQDLPLDVRTLRQSGHVSHELSSL